MPLHSGNFALVQIQEMWNVQRECFVPEDIIMLIVTFVGLWCVKLGAWVGLVIFKGSFFLKFKVDLK